MKSNDLSGEYKVFVTEIKQRILDAQYAALKSVNKELIGLYRFRPEPDRYHFLI